MLLTDHGGEDGTIMDASSIVLSFRFFAKCHRAMVRRGPGDLGPSSGYLLALRPACDFKFDLDSIMVEAFLRQKNDQRSRLQVDTNYVAELPVNDFRFGLLSLVTGY